MEWPLQAQHADAESIITIANSRGEHPWPRTHRRRSREILRQIHRKVREAICRTRDRLTRVFLMESAAGAAGGDPLRLIGAAIIGALSQWLFNRAVKKAFPPPGRDHDRRVLAELKHIREQIQLMQGDLQGLGHRVGALERTNG